MYIFELFSFPSNFDVYLFYRSFDVIVKMKPIWTYTNQNNQTNKLFTQFLMDFLRLGRKFRYIHTFTQKQIKNSNQLYYDHNAIYAWELSKLSRLLWQNKWDRTNWYTVYISMHIHEMDWINYTIRKQKQKILESICSICDQHRRDDPDWMIHFRKRE